MFVVSKHTYVFYIMFLYHIVLAWGYMVNKACTLYTWQEAHLIFWNCYTVNWFTFNEMFCEILSMVLERINLWPCQEFLYFKKSIFYTILCKVQITGKSILHLNGITCPVGLTPFILVWNVCYDINTTLIKSLNKLSQVRSFSYC